MVRSGLGGGLTLQPPFNSKTKFNATESLSIVRCATFHFY